MIAKILFDDRAAHQYDPREAEETDILVQTIIPITRAVPLSYLYASYVEAKENREIGNNFQISGDEILSGWKILKGKLEMRSLSSDMPLLPDAAVSACERCFGVRSGLEITPQGARRCDHSPLTPEEIQERERREAEARERLKKISAQNAEARRPPAVRSTDETRGERFVCSGCSRRVSSLLGWRFGETCNAPVGAERAPCLIEGCGGESVADPLDPADRVCRKCGARASRLCKGQMQTITPEQAAEDEERRREAIEQAKRAAQRPAIPVRGSQASAGRKRGAGRQQTRKGGKRR